MSCHFWIFLDALFVEIVVTQEVVWFFSFFSINCQVRNFFVLLGQVLFFFIWKFVVDKDLIQCFVGCRYLLFRVDVGILFDVSFSKLSNLFWKGIVVKIDRLKGRLICILLRSLNTWIYCLICTLVLVICFSGFRLGFVFLFR